MEFAFWSVKFGLGFLESEFRRGSISARAQAKEAGVPADCG